jgi:thioredoxin-dependent peroxiredoxin
VELKPGMPAPPFELVDQDGKVWTLEDLKGQKVVLYFYPADHTPGCTKEACDFRDSHSSFQNAGYLVLGISPQDRASHRSFADDYQLPFPLLVDDDLKTAFAYGVTSPDSSGDRDALKRLRSTFVVDEEGVVERADYAVSSKTHVGELRDTLGLTTIA